VKLLETFFFLGYIWLIWLILLIFWKFWFFFNITQLKKKLKNFGTLRIKINSCAHNSNFYYILYIGEVYFAWPFFFSFHQIKEFSYDIVKFIFKGWHQCWVVLEWELVLEPVLNPDLILRIDKYQISSYPSRKLTRQFSSMWELMMRTRLCLLKNKNKNQMGFFIKPISGSQGFFIIHIC
jgi:hypothetical protein